MNKYIFYLILTKDHAKGARHVLQHKANLMYPILKKQHMKTTFTGILFLLAFIFAAPSFTMAQDKPKGPPSCAPAHGYRAKTSHIISLNTTCTMTHTKDYSFI